MDPWMMGLLAMFASQNPGKAGPMLDKLGIAPPTPDMLGGPKPYEPLFGAGQPTGPTTNITPKFSPPGSLENEEPVKTPHAIPQRAPSMIPGAPAPQLASGLPGLTAPPLPSSPTQFPPEAPPEGNAPVVPPFQTEVNLAPAGLGGPDIWDSLVAQAQANPTGAQPPDPNADAAAQAKALMGLAAVQGIKPPAPVTPIMGGGVVGGVKPPDTAKSLQAGSPAINALMAALLHPGNQDPLRVPTLGSFIRGGKY